MVQAYFMQLPANLAGSRQLQNAVQFVLNDYRQTILFYFGPTWSEVALRRKLPDKLLGSTMRRKKQSGLI